MGEDPNKPPYSLTELWWRVWAFITGQPFGVQSASKWTEAEKRWNAQKLREELKEKWFSSEPVPTATLPLVQQAQPDVIIDKCIQGAYLLNNSVFGQAAEILHEAVIEEPQNPWPVLMLRYAYSRLDRHNDALAEVQSGLQRMPGNVSLQLDLSRAYVAARDLASAEKILREILEKRPDQADALVGLADLLLKRGQPEEPLRLMDRLVTRLPQDIHGWANKAWALIQLGRESEAEALLQKCCRDWPGVSRFRAQLGEMAVTKRDYLRAVAEFRAAIERDGVPERFMAQLASACLNAGLDKEGLEAADKAVVYDKRPAIRMIRAVALARLSRVTEAEDEIALLGAQPSKPAAYNAAFVFGALANVCEGEKRQQYCRRVLEMLEAAKPLPKRLVDGLEQDKDLALVAPMPEFQELLVKLRAEAK